MMSTDIISGIAEVEDKRNVANPLKPREVQERFISHYAITGHLGDSCFQAGISEPTGRKWLQDPRFVAAVFRYRQMQLSGHGAGLAYGVLVEIMTKVEVEDGKARYYAGPAERRQAAKTVLELAGHTPALAESLAQAQQTAALHDLTEDQLEAHIRAGQELLGNLRSSAESGVTPALTPNVAAEGLL